MPTAPQKRVQGGFVREKKDTTREITVNDSHYKRGDPSFVDERKKKKKKSLADKYDL